MKTIPPTPPVAGSFRLTDEERAQQADAGYVVRTGVFTADEVATIADECEALVDNLVRDRRGHRMRAGSYVFDPDLTRLVIMKWEGDSDVLHGIEPFAHLDDDLRSWALDARFLEPMQDFVGSDTPELFTEKLNLKRPQHGGVNPLHQDYPYWVDVADDPTEVATAMLFLDDSTLVNGCLYVVPGSHRAGMWTRRTDGDPFLGNEIDVAAYPDAGEVPVEVEAGSIVMFGSYLVHRSDPNRSDAPRRAILLSYQPSGRPHMLDSLRKYRR